MIARVNTLKPMVTTRIADVDCPRRTDLRFTATTAIDVSSIPRRIPGNVRMKVIPDPPNPRAISAVCSVWC